MKKILIIAALFLCSLYSVKAQSEADKALETIEQNNTQLKALRELSGAEKLDNKSANNLPNPEVEVTHMPKARGNFATTGIEATQEFDFPTAYRYRGQTIELQNERVDLEYEVKRRDILLEARALIVKCVYQKKMLNYLEERVEYAEALHVAYISLFEKGDINILERNKTKLNLLEANKNLEMAMVDIQSTETELARLNGGEPLLLGLDFYSSYQLPLSFDSWFESVKHNNPTLLLADKDLDISRKQEQLARSLNLPKLKAGYVGDLVKNDSRHGFLISVRVPLWEGRNTIKSKKAQTVAMQYEKEDQELQYKNGLKVNYQRAYKLSILLKEYSEIIDNSNNFILLKKSFDMGQLSLIEYLQELIIYNEAVDNYFTAERDYYLVLAELEQWER